MVDTLISEMGWDDASRGDSPDFEDDPEDTEEEDTAEEGDTEEEGAEKEEKIAPAFANVFDWVDGFLAPVITRRINAQDGRGLAWTANWWLYPEVLGRLTALHQAWEGARAAKNDPLAMSGWWVQHLEPHLRVILDGDTGPMSHASGGGPHPPLATVPAPAELRAYVLKKQL